MAYYQASNIKQKDKEAIAIALEIIPLPRSHLVPKLFAARTSPNSVTKSLQTLERFKTITREGKKDHNFCKALFEIQNPPRTTDLIHTPTEFSPFR